jgi:hypothetical protein
MKKSKKKLMAIELFELLLFLIGTFSGVIFMQIHNIIISMNTNVFCGICAIITYLLIRIVVRSGTAERFDPEGWRHPKGEWRPGERRTGPVPEAATG